MDTSKLTRSGRSPERLVRLLAVVGCGTGVLFLGTLSWVLYKIKDDRIEDNRIDVRATEALISADRLFIDSKKYSEQLLKGKTVETPPAVKPWVAPFSQIAKSGERSLALDDQLVEASERLKESIESVVGFETRCLEFNRRYRQQRTAREKKQLALQQRFHDLRSAFATDEGRKLLNLAVRIREYRQLEGDDRQKMADSILRSWSHQPYLGAAETELADLSHLCQQFINETNADVLIDFKENKFHQVLTRLRHLIKTNTNTETIEAQLQLLADLEHELYGEEYQSSGSSRDKARIGGLYADSVRWLDLQVEQARLAKASQDIGTQFQTARRNLHEQLERIARESADDAVELVERSWQTIAILGSLMAVLFIVIARKVSQTIVAQFRTLEKTSLELAETTAELRDSAEHLRMLSLVAKYTDNAVMITNPRGRVEWVNEGYTRLSGYALEEIKGRFALRFFQGQKTDRDTIEYMSGRVRRQKGFDVEVIRYSKSGRSYWVAMEARPIMDETGNVVQYIAIERDITLRKEAEQERERLTAIAQESSSELKRHLQAIGKSQAVIEFRMDGTVITANQLFLNVFGYKLRDIVGKNHSMFCDGHYAESEEYRDFWDKLNYGRFDTNEYKLIGKDGKEIWVQATYNPILDKMGQPFKVVQYASDISDQKALQQDFADASRQAGMAEVATGVLHNVGNILNSVNVSVDLLHDKLRHSAVEQLRKAADVVARHEDDLGSFLTQDEKGKHLPALLNVIADTLSNERDCELKEIQELAGNIDHIKQIVSMQQSYAKRGGVVEEIEANELMLNAIKMNDASLGNRNVAVVTDFAELPKFQASKHDVLQIIVNLIKNAGQALEKCTKKQRTISLHTYQRDGFIHFEVSDNGIGVAPENLSRIFQHGFTTKTDGHGFGLHAAANTAQEMGGSLTADSDGLQQGATFVLKLPLNASNKASSLSTSDTSIENDNSRESLASTVMPTHVLPAVESSIATD